MTVIGYALVAPSVTMAASDHVEVAGVARGLRRVVHHHETSAGLAARASEQVADEKTLRDADPQAWLFAQRTRHLTYGFCDPYAEQMLRRMGLLPPLT